MREIIDAALRRQRRAATGAVILGALLGLLCLLWKDDPARLLPTAAPLAALFAYYGFFRRPSRAGLRQAPDRSAFYAPPRGAVTFVSVFLAWLPFQLAWYGSRWERDAFGWMFLLGSVAAIAVFGHRQWTRLPMLRITPDGVASDGPQRAMVVPWSALDPLGPPPATEHDSELRLPLARPEQATRRRRRRAEERVWLRDLDVAPPHLAAAINHYLRHPEHRAAIGTPEEYARLRRALGGAS
ncbi:hypothetical protein ACN26Y_04430 [Micromonospora sp. WMMD558]|uniref:hypothetical protein n=1 Tax=unclassified Micromonospora TaxID=2617518 RepID=UPI0012B4612C|nr:hypothetical protein [Micromonospora sp. WMMC415]QGN45576.1 hypothetical protein GKC29_01025 [Micromonospora sp. WMMC415]